MVTENKILDVSYEAAEDLSRQLGYEGYQD